MSVDTKGKYLLNPTLKGGKPTVLGRTKTNSNGQLFYLNPMNHTWGKHEKMSTLAQWSFAKVEAERAVHLDTIRPRLVQEEDTDLYDHPKARGLDDTDVTTFLAKDKTFGLERSTRAPILFKIFNIDGIRGARATGYVKDRGMIVLDPFDHGIRDFPELPKCLSSNLGGHDITYYMRQNQYIKFYDLLARMPSKFRHSAKQKVKMPMYSTIGMRATRFRLQCVLLAWQERDGSHIKNQRMLDLIPDFCKNPLVNSTRDFRDFNDLELRILNGEKSRAKRTQPEKDAADRAAELEREVRGFNGDDDNRDDDHVNNENGDDEHVNNDNGVYDFEETEVDALGESSEDEGLIRTLWEGASRLTPISLPDLDIGTQKQDRDHFSDDSEEDRHALHAKRSRVKVPSQRKSKVRISDQVSVIQMERSSMRDRYSITNGNEGQQPEVRILRSIEGPQVPAQGPEGRTLRSNGDPQGSTQQPEGRSRRSNGAPQVPTRESDSDSSVEVEPSMGTFVASVIQSPDHLGARLINARALQGEQFPELTDQSSPFNRRVEDREPDYRYTLPDIYPETADEDVKAIQMAVDMCRADFYWLTNTYPPRRMREAYKFETYNMQRTRLQEELAKVWPGFTPQLYWLTGWKGGFGNWRAGISDIKGQELLSKVSDV